MMKTPDEQKPEWLQRQEEIKAKTADPKEGYLGTYHIGSDSYPVKVIARPSAKRVIVTTMHVAVGSPYFPERTGGCVLVDDPDAEPKILSLRKNGIWREVGQPVGYYTFGEAVYKLDPSF